MTGILADGRKTSVSRTHGPKRPVPPGPLTPEQIRDLEITLSRGMAGEGFTDFQIGQVLKFSERTAARLVEGVRRNNRTSKDQDN